MWYVYYIIKKYFEVENYEESKLVCSPGVLIIFRLLLSSCFNECDDWTKHFNSVSSSEVFWCTRGMKSFANKVYLWPITTVISIQSLVTHIKMPRIEVRLLVRATVKGFKIDNRVERLSSMQTSPDRQSHLSGLRATSKFVFSVSTSVNWTQRPPPVVL